MAFPPFPAFPANLITLYTGRYIYENKGIYVYSRVENYFYREHRENREQTQKT